MRSSTALQKYQPASGTAKLLAVQESQPPLSRIHREQSPRCPPQVPPSSSLFIASTSLTQERQSPFLSRYESQILVSFQGWNAWMINKQSLHIVRSPLQNTTRAAGEKLGTPDKINRRLRYHLLAVISWYLLPVSAGVPRDVIPDSPVTRNTL